MSIVGTKIISRKSAAELLGVHVTTVCRWDAQGSFAPKIQLGPRRVGYLEADVTAWLNERRKVA